MRIPGFSRLLALGCLLPCLIHAQTDEPIPAAPPTQGTLSRIIDLRNLTPDQAGTRIPVHITGTVTMSNEALNLLFLHDATGGIFIHPADPTPYPLFGSRVEVRGHTREGAYLPVVYAETIRALDPETSREPVPEGTPGTIGELATGRFDSQWISTRGHVVSVRVARRHLLLTLAGDRRTIEALLPFQPQPDPESLRGADIALSGTVGTLTDGNRGLEGIRVFVPQQEYVRVTRTPADVRRDAPTHPLGEIVRPNGLSSAGPLRTRGQVTASIPGQFWIEDEGGAIRCSLPSGQPPPDLSSQVTVLGCLVTNGPMRWITVTQLLSAEPGPDRPSVAVAPKRLFDQDHRGRLVHVTASYLHRPSAAPQRTLVFRADDSTFEAEWPPSLPAEALSRLVPGAQYRLTGVIRTRAGAPGDPPSPSLQLRRESDLVLTTAAPWPLHRTLTVVIALALGLIAGLAALWLSHRHLREANLRLQAAHHTVEKLNQELEQRVMERTADLAATNHELEEENRARKRTERDLADRESRLRDAQAIAHIGNFAWDIATGQVSWSDELYRIFGVSPDSFTPSHANFLAAVHPEDRPDITERIRRCIDLGQPTEHDYRIVRGDGQVRWMTARVRPLLAPDGTPRGLEGTCQDITRWKLAAAELAASEQRFNRAFHAGPFASALSRLDPLVIIEINDAFVDLFGYPRDEVIGQDCETLGLWVDSNLRVEALRRVRTEGRLRGFEMEFRRKSGTTGTARYNIEQITIDGELFALYMIEDITDRKALENQLLQARKLEAVGTLAGGIAHDFNNILAAMLGHSELAREQAGHNAAAIESLDEVLVAGRRARDLIRRMLAFSRPQEPQQRVLLLQESATDTLRLLRAALPANTELRPVFVPDTPPILADPTQIQQVILNLVTNSAQALSSGGGWVEVRVDSIPAHLYHGTPPPSFAGHSRLVRLTVADNGAGIDPATMPRIFEPFFTTKATGQGSGLGLSVVHGIVQAHGGIIDVESNPGHGTRFTLLFAPTDNLPHVPPAPAPDPKPDHPWHVLFIDDEPSLNSAATRILTRAGFRVTSSRNPIEALERFRAQPLDFDVVVTDFTMPHRDGFELGRDMLRIRPGVPILLCSGYATHVSRQDILAAGFQDLLLKPIDSHTLKHAILNAVQALPRPSTPPGASNPQAGHPTRSTR